MAHDVARKLEVLVASEGYLGLGPEEKDGLCADLELRAGLCGCAQALPDASHSAGGSAPTAGAGTDRLYGDILLHAHRLIDGLARQGRASSDIFVLLDRLMDAYREGVRSLKRMEAASVSSPPAPSLSDRSGWTQSPR